MNPSLLSTLAGRYFAALRLWLPVLPMLIAATCLVNYLLNPRNIANYSAEDQLYSAGMGIVWAFGVWLIANLVAMFGLSAKRANPTAYADLRERVDELVYAKKAYCPHYEEAGPSPRTDHEKLNREAEATLCETIANVKRRLELDRQSSDPGEDQGQWANGVGYAELKVRVHRAEEALFELAPVEKVVEEAAKDKRRLQGSNIPDQDELIGLLDNAVATLEGIEGQALGEPRKNLSGTLEDAVKALKAATSDEERNNIINILDHVTAALDGIDSRTTDEQRKSLGRTLQGTVKAWKATSTVNERSNVIRTLDNAVATLEGIEGQALGEPRKNLSGTLEDAVKALKAATSDEECNNIINILDHVTAALDGIDSRTTDEQPRHKEGTQREKAKSVARRKLYAIRHTINEYRDTRYNSLILARERVGSSIFWTGMFGLLLLLLAIILYPTYSPKPGIPHTFTLDLLYNNRVVAGVIYFAIGALVGLFNRMRLDGRNTANLEQDYGFAQTRLVHTALLSGLAAVGGLIVVALVPAIASSLVPVPADLPKSLISPRYLDDIFSLWANPFGLLIAAVFGLSPSLFTSALEQQADKIKEDLSKSKPDAGQPQRQQPA